MNRKTISFILLSIVSVAPVFFFSCKKESAPSDGVYVTPAPECDTSEAMLNEWYFYKTGSYWTYIDSAMGLYDSIYVYDHEEYSFVHASWIYKTYSTFHDEFFNWRTPAESGRRFCITSPDCRCQGVKKSRFGTGGYFTTAYQFIYPIIAGERYYVYSTSIASNYLTCLEIIPSMTVSGVEYHDVVKWELPSDPTAHGWKTIQYVAKNVGIIRSEWPSIGRRWDLRSYRVYQN